MSDKETKDGFKVSDKRHFRMEEDGSVKKREETSAEPPADAGPPPGTEQPRDPKAEMENCECKEEYTALPALDFISFAFSLTTSTMVFLGVLPDPATKQTKRDLGLAKQYIDLLGMLQEKTKGNLTAEENQFLQDSLYDLRVRFVEACQHKHE